MSIDLNQGPDCAGGRSAVDYYLYQDDGGMFKCTQQYDPYFHISTKVSISPHFYRARRR